jgi:DNA-binding transcriptional regulator YiaG
MTGRDIYMLAENCAESPFINISRKAFAECLGIHHVTLSKYGGENAKQPVSGPLAQLAALIQQRPEVLFVLRNDI